LGLAAGENVYSFGPNVQTWNDPLGLCKKKVRTAIDNKVTDIDQQKLPDWIAKSFTDSQYRTVVTKEDVTLYRVFGGNSDAGGAFATTAQAGNRINAKISCALLPEWGGSKMYEATIVVPKGQILNIGKVAPQTIKSTGTVLDGGADQILMPQNWPLDWIKGVKNVPSR